MSAPPEWLNSAFMWVMRATWQASVIIVLVLLTQFLLQKVLPARWRHGLWLLVLIRLALPFSFESPVSIFNITVPVSTMRAVRVSPESSIPVPPPAHPGPGGSISPPVSRPSKTAAAVDTKSPLVAPVAPVQGFRTPRIGRRQIMFALPFFWLLGILLLLAQIVWANARLTSRLRHRHPLSDLELLRLAAECRQVVGLRQTPWIVETPEVRGPALFGFSVPRLLLPKGLLEEFTLQELRHVFLHEFCHVRRRDIALNWLATLLQVLHWFNPLVWIALSRMRSDRELVCDAMVLSRLQPSETKDYGKTIIRLLESFTRPTQTPGLVGILEDPGQMKRRVRMILRFRIDSGRWRWAAAACAALLTIATLTDARTHLSQNQGVQGSGPERPMVFQLLDVETGSPIAGATVNGKHTTDRRGKCEIRTAIPTVLIFKAAGFMPQFLSLEVEGAGEQTLRMERAVTIGGIVRDETGNPIRDAEVHLLGSSITLGRLPSEYFPFPTHPIVTTNAAGRWQCTEAPRDLEGLSIRLYHPDYAAAFYTPGIRRLEMVHFAEGKLQRVSLADLMAQQAEWIMKRGFPVIGSVLDPQGKPVEGASVRLGLVSWPEENRGETKTDPNGRFIFRNGVSASATLAVQARGFVLHNKAYDLAMGMPEIKIYLMRGEKLHGRVIDETGKPVEGALVTSSEGAMRERTDEDGRFSWDSAPGRPFMVQVRTERYAVANEPIEPGLRENVIRLRNFREIRVAGKVVDAATHQPIPEFRVLTSTSRLGADGWQNYRHAAIGKNGSFSLSLRDSFRASGTVVQSDDRGDRVVRYVVGLKIQADGYFPDTSQSVAIENGDVSLEVILDRGSGTSGTVLLPGGEPASGARVFLSGKLGLQMPAPGRIEAVIDDSPEVLTDRAGSFQFEPKQDARAVVAIHEKGFALVPIEKMAARSALVLVPWARIEGTLRIGSSLGANEILMLTGSILESKPPALMLTMQSQTDEAGRFVFTRVPPGTHQIMLPRQFGARSTGLQKLATVEVKAGETRHISLGGTGRPIVGKVALVAPREPVVWNRFTHLLETAPPDSLKDANGGPGSTPLWMSAQSESEEARKYFRDRLNFPVLFAPDGSFRIEDVPAGTYWLRLHIPGLPNNTFIREVTVPEISGGRHDTPLDLGTITIR